MIHLHHSKIITLSLSLSILLIGLACLVTLMALPAQAILNTYTFTSVDFNTILLSGSYTTYSNLNDVSCGTLQCTCPHVTDTAICSITSTEATACGCYALSASSATPTPTPTATPSSSSGPSLTVTLKAATDSNHYAKVIAGTAPINGVDLRATVTGNGSESITYKFDCNNDGVYEATYTNINTNPKSINDLCNYSATGTYTAVVLATSAGLSGYDSVTIQVLPGAPGSYTSWTTPRHSYPQVGLSWSPTTPNVSQNTRFTDQTRCYALGNASANCSTWSWAFGDGGISTSQNPNHSYALANSYNVKLTTTDADLNQCSVTKVINVGTTIPTFKEVSPQ